VVFVSGADVAAAGSAAETSAPATGRPALEPDGPFAQALKPAKIIAAAQTLPTDRILRMTLPRPFKKILRQKQSRQLPRGRLKHSDNRAGGIVAICTIPVTP
jgi:hypothetical protein